MEVEASPKVNGFHTPPASSDTALDPAEIHQYLYSLLTLTLGAAKDDLESDHNLLGEHQRRRAIEQCNSFLQGNRVALYASKRELSEPQPNGNAEYDGNDQEPAPTRHVLTNVSSSVTKALSILFVR